MEIEKKIFLTGATGFIGYNIALLLLKEGYHVRLLVRKPFELLKHKNIEFIYGDIRNYDNIVEAVKGCHIVIHTAGLFTFDSTLKKEIYEVNVKGTENICKAIVNSDIERFIYTSSAATIGKSPNSLSDENTTFNLWKISSHYKKSKVLAEQVVFKYYEQYKMPVVILNPSLPLGFYDLKPTSTGMMVKSFIDNKSKIYINGGFNFVHVYDVAKSHLLAINNGRVGQKYIIGNENVTLKDFYVNLQKIHLSTKLVQIPYFIALCMSFFNAVVCFLRKKQPSVTPAGVRLSKKKMFYDTSKSQKELGIIYTPFDKAVEDSVKWFKKDYYEYK